MRVDEPEIERISLADMQRCFMAFGFPTRIHFFFPMILFSN
jgi:hypothetical protein